MKLVQNSWNLGDVISVNHSIPIKFIEAAGADNTENFIRLLARDVYSEADSQSLYDYLTRPDRQWGISTEVFAFLRMWLEDELKHYRAIQRVYRAVSGVSYEHIEQQEADRVHEVEPINFVLKDEFTFLVALAFDEFGSTLSYRRDLQEYYRHYGPEVASVCQHLVRDEGAHAQNAIQLLIERHGHRLGEVEETLSQIIELEASLGRYCKTFFLDHAQEQNRFPPFFNEVVVQIILSRLGLADKPSGARVRETWNWKPVGQHLTPVA